MEKTNGIYKIDCKVNGIPMNFIFDTGASNVSISKTEASFLIKQGLITKEDIIGTINYQIANGEIHEGTKINLKTIEIKGLVIENVTATVVHEQNSPLLLGQSLLSRLGKISIDGNILTIHNNSSNQNTTNYNPLKFIDEVSNFTEVFAGNKMVHSSKINFDKSNGKFSIIEKHNYGKKIDTRELNFYVEDIIKSGAKYDINEIGDGQYSVYLEISTKSKSVEWIDFNIERGKEHLSITDKKYIDKIRVYANGNLISKFIAEKYIKSWSQLFGLKNLINDGVKKEIQSNNQIDFKPKMMNSTLGIILGSNVNDYDYLIKKTDDNINEFKRRINNKDYSFNYEKTHYADLSKLNYSTFGGEKILGVFIGTIEDRIWEISIITEFNINLYNKMLIEFGKPAFYGKSEHPDAITYWENDNFEYYILANYFNIKIPNYYSIQLIDKKLKKRYKNNE